MFGNTMRPGTSLIVVCDDKDVTYANYLIQLIGQKDDTDEEIVGIADDSVSAAIYTTKFYMDNLPQIPSSQHILFIGDSKPAKEQRKTIKDKFDKLGMHYGWLGKRAFLYVDDSSCDWLKLKADRETYEEFLNLSKEYGQEHEDVLATYAEKAEDRNLVDKIIPLVGASKMVIDRNKAVNEFKLQQYMTAEKAFYNEDLKAFMEE